MREDTRDFVAILLSLAVAVVVSYTLLHLREQLTHRSVSSPIILTR
jgi:hypothetical protein